MTAIVDPIFGLPYEPCHHWFDEGFVGGCEDCHRDEYVTEIIRLRSVIADVAHELGEEHRPDWASEKAKAAGKDPVWCVICGTADGSWPCVSSLVAEDLTEGLTRHEGRIVKDGFGSEWLRCGPGCDLHVVRPGKAQCNCESRQYGSEDER